MLRGAPQIPLDGVASVAGMSTRMLKDRLRSLQSRGACHDAAVELSKSKRRVAERNAALGYRGCPPSLRRAASLDSSENVRNAGTGAACWASRDKSSPAAPRSVMATATLAGVSMRSQLRTIQTTAASPACPPMLLSKLVLCSIEALANPGCAPHALAELSARKGFLTARRWHATQGCLCRC